MVSSDVPKPTLRQRFNDVLRRWLLRLAGVYLLVVAVMWLFENRLVYFPVIADHGWEAAPSPLIEDIHFTSSDGTALHGWWLPADEQSPVFVLFHGNGGNLSTRGDRMLNMRQHLGVSVFIFDYPGYGKSAGKPNEQGCYAAAEGAIQWLIQTKNIPAERMIFYGESLGGGVALEMALRYPCRALALIKTFTALPDVAQRRYPWLPVRWLMSNRYNNRAKIGRVHCPVFFAKATNDEVIPPEHTDQLYALANEPKQLFAAEGTGHNDPLPPEFWPTLRIFLQLPEPPKT